MKISKVNLSDKVSNDMIEKIKNGTYSEGTKLPSENDLAELYDVNRLTIRLALNKLATLELIETRVGEGSFIVRPNLSELIKKTNGLLIDDDNVIDFEYFRLMLEIESAKIFINNTRDMNILDKEKILDKPIILLKEYKKYCRTAIKDFNSYEFIAKSLEFEWKFHSSLIELTNNSIFISFYEITRSYLDNYFELIVEKRITDGGVKRFVAASLKNHSNLINDLKKSNLDDYEKHIRNMIDYTEHNNKES